MFRNIILITFFFRSLSIIAQEDSHEHPKIDKFIKQVSVGISGTQNYFASSNFGANRVSHFGFQTSYKGFVLNIGPTILNKIYFEKNNYVIGGRDKRKIPISGFGSEFYYIKNAFNDKPLHLVLGIQFLKNTVYGGWTTVKVYNSNTYKEYKISRLVNFDDKFYQTDLMFGFSFSHKNQFGFVLLTNLGVNKQNTNNSHLNYVKVDSTGIEEEIFPKSKEIGLSIGVSIKVFYNIINSQK
jgi:hypothetical protein